LLRSTPQGLCCVDWGTRLHVRNDQARTADASRVGAAATLLADTSVINRQTDIGGVGRRGRHRPWRECSQLVLGQVVLGQVVLGRGRGGDPRHDRLGAATTRVTSVSTFTLASTGCRSTGERCVRSRRPCRGSACPKAWRRKAPSTADLGRVDQDANESPGHSAVAFPELNPRVIYP